MRKHAARVAGAGLVAAVALISGAPAHELALADARQTVCGATTLCPADPAPDGGDQATAEQRVIDGYIKKQVNCTPNLPPNPQSVTWDPPGFAPYVGGTGAIRDANPQLGGVYSADYVNGRWHIEYPYC